MTLTAAMATAYNVPAVRILGPAWLATTRYSINAVVSSENLDAFESLLQQELGNRLSLEAHIERDSTGFRSRARLGRRSNRLGVQDP